MSLLGIYISFGSVNLTTELLAATQSAEASDAAATGWLANPPTCCSINVQLRGWEGPRNGKSDTTTRTRAQGFGGGAQPD